MNTNTNDERISHRKSLTLGELADILEAQLPPEIEPDSACGLVTTQSVYVEPGDAVISADWYWHKKIIPESLEKGAAVVFCSHKIKKKIS